LEAILKKKQKTYPREYYKAAIEAYERVRKLIDYGKETAHLKRIFGWLESMDCLSLESVESLVETHRMLVYKPYDKLWASVPFCPTGLSYNMFNRLFQLIQQKKSTANDYQEALEESYREA
jgi:hypothetical protein